MKVYQCKSSTGSQNNLIITNYKLNLVQPHHKLGSVNTWLIGGEYLHKGLVMHQYGILLIIRLTDIIIQISADTDNQSNV